ncbi:MAG: hypothetical protein DRP87_06730 [Spirochaetes bacterium]|nr:MAG: hypothetical protein DRP87_06730 [Spirochaetota bacterium]
MLFAYLPVMVYEIRKNILSPRFTPVHPFFSFFFLFWFLSFILFIQKYIIIKPVFDPDEDMYEYLFNRLKLTKREKEILQLILQGNMNKEISWILGISLPAVKSMLPIFLKN